MMSKSISALYKTKTEASSAIDGLLAQGIANKDLSVLMSDSTSDKEFKVEVNSKAPEGAATGAAVGGAIGALAAGLTAVGTITLTGGAGLVAVGPAVAALAGAGAGGAAGGVVGGLVGLGFDENEAKLVERRLDNGSILLSAEIPDDRKDDIETQLKNYGAEKVTVH
jgi:hypothetical protein